MWNIYWFIDLRGNLYMQLNLETENNTHTFSSPSERKQNHKELNSSCETRTKCGF